MYPSSFLVHIDDYLAVFDCGPRIPEAVERSGRKLPEIDLWVITHLDGAHTGGLEEVALRMKYEYNQKPTIMAPGFILEGIKTSLLPALLHAEQRFTGGATVSSSFEDFFDCEPARNLKIKEDDGVSESIILVPHSEISSCTSYGILFEEHKILLTGAHLVDPKWLAFNGLGSKFIGYDMNLTRTNWLDSFKKIQELPRDLQEVTWLYGYNQDFKKMYQPEKEDKLPFLEQHTCILDNNREVEILTRTFKKKLPTKIGGQPSINSSNGFTSPGF